MFSFSILKINKFERSERNGAQQELVIFQSLAIALYILKLHSNLLRGVEWSVDDVIKKPFSYGRYDGKLEIVSTAS